MNIRVGPSQAFLPQPGRASCAVCWQEFQEHAELDSHIRVHHPDRLLDQEELVARARSRRVLAPKTGVTLASNNY